MATVNLTSVTNIKLLPLVGVMFYEGTADNLYIFQLEAESSLIIEPRIRRHYKRKNICLGFDVTAKLYVPHDNYASNGLIAKLDYIRGKILDQSWTDTQLYFGTQVTPNPDAITLPTAYNSTAGLLADFDNTLTVYYSIETVDRRLRMVITLEGFVKDLTSVSGSALFKT